jgi:serine/threonine-protein kinase
VSLLGKGGMGEVYKAEDLKLHQTVALKFLPEAIALDAAALARFHNEVRIARQVAHQNVCHVYDIGEVEGLHFLSMEFIDGEDLGALLKKVGRLPGDKAIELARQLCAGLSAAHEAGVLHRDLKPANVMIDWRGRARITDFGLAVVSEELGGEDVQAGTPAYMAPEQLAGKEVTQRSDIYALGLVLYELFTGKRVFEAKSVDELMELHEKSTPPTPSSHLKEIDPLAERVILRCLEKDPQARPASAVQVALALPGGDPLQAAVALGETPSPEMVAAAGEKTGLRPIVALACLLAVIISLSAVAYLNHRGSLLERVPFESSPEVLARKGREIIAQLGYPERPFDSTYGLQIDNSYLKYIEETDKSRQRWDRLQLGRSEVIHLWYREGPSALVPSGRFSWEVDDSDPPKNLPGMVGVELDTLGRLLNFRASPPALIEESQRTESNASPSMPDWKTLFTLAGLEVSRFTPANPHWNPESICDARAAWTGTLAEMPDLSLRVEAASYQGKFVFFQLIYPWTKPAALQTPWTWVDVIGTTLLASTLLGAALLARHNYKRGRGDRRGAFRLVYLAFGSSMLVWLFTAKHVPSINEFALLIEGIRSALFLSAALCVLYLALEPYVRRRWPTSLITWSRALNGKLTDPLVGRDLLLGILGGILVQCLPRLTYLATNRVPPFGSLHALLGLRNVIGQSFNALVTPVMLALGVVFVLTMVRALLRRDWLAAVVVALILSLVVVIPTNTSAVTVLGALVFFSLTLVVFMRLGLLALVAAIVMFFPLNILPLTTNFSTWYSGTTLYAFCIALALAAFAFRTSLGGQKLFEGKLLEE